MNRSEMFVISHPKSIIAATLAVTIGFVAVLVQRGLSFNGSPETLTRDDNALRFFNDVRSTFGDDRVIVVALTTGDVFTEEFINRLYRLTRRISALEGVDEAMSLTNLHIARRDSEGVRIENVILPETFGPRYDDERINTIKQEVTRDPLYARHYVSADGRSAAISVFLKPLVEEQTRVVVDEIERAAKEEAGEDELMLAGIPIMDARAIESMVTDMLICSPVAGLLCFVVFLAVFRSFWGAMLPMAALIIGLVWTFGLMTLVDRPVTFATLPLPTVLMAVGSSFIFHVLNQYHISVSKLDSSLDKSEWQAAWNDGLKFITPVVLVSGTITMAGFGSLASSSVPTVRDMGIFEALGVGAMLILSLAFIPAVLAMLSKRALRISGAPQKDYAAWLNNMLRSFTALILFRRRSVLLVSLAITLLIGAGVARLRVNTDYLRIFPESSETVRAAEKLHERLAGAATIQVVVSGARGAVARPDFLQAVAAVEEFSLAQPGVDAAISVADIIKRLNSVVYHAANGGETIPEDGERIESLFDDFLSQDKSILRLVNEDRSRAIIVLRTNLFGSNELRGLTNKIESWARARLPQGVSAQTTGSFVLLNDASDEVADSQLSSLAIALVSIYLMMVVLFRSLRTALLALIPNLLPIICYFGFLGWMGITLDITTSLVASAALGLAVDNAVHMIRRYHQALKERGGNLATDEGWVMWLTMLRTGKPMVLANLMLLAAFLIFMLSSFIPVRVAGLLWAVTIFACLAANLFFLPALIKSSYFARIEPGNKRADEQVYAGVKNISD